MSIWKLNDNTKNQINEPPAVAELTDIRRFDYQFCNFDGHISFKF